MQAVALVALGRVHRQRGDATATLDAYRRLEALGAVPVGGQPAALLALQGRCKVLETIADGEGLRKASADLARALHSGAWPTDRATFDLYREMLDRWGAAPPPPEDVVRTEAALRVWQLWRAGGLPPRGRRTIPSDGGEAVTLAVWAGGPASPTLWIGSAVDLDAALAPLWTPHSLVVSAFDADGRRLFGAGRPAGAISLTPGETRLPFILSVWPSVASEATETSRRRFVMAGLVGALCLMFAAAYGLYRSMSRELMLVRQQSDFVAAVSHEFRTPLTSMRHLMDLLVSRGVTTEERRAQYYELLSHETERLYRMVETLLSFGRIEAGAYAFERQPVDVGDVVQASAEEFRAEHLAASRHVHCDVEAGLPSIHADRETIVRALWNLLENAAKYSEAGTPIRVTARRGDDAVLIGVEDHGIGIPREERHRIFHKFVRGADATRDGIRGVGIGLALVTRIVEAHRGSVSVESEPGRGSTFTLRLPLPAPES